MNINTKVPPVTPFIELKLENNIIDYLWMIINNSHNDNVNHKQFLAGNISKSYLLKDIDDFFFKSVCIPLITCFRENNLGVDPHSFNISFNNPHNIAFKLNSLWVNYQYKTEFNPYHDHGGIYSFAIWLKIPYDSKEQQNLPMFDDMNNKNKKAGDFEFEYHDTLGSIRNISYKLSKRYEGTMLFFPAKLRHCVYPFYETDEPRISIAGNLNYFLID
tara:strand:+ start:203 stop:853 length:651 start_codon:yes stop_codon:yes gene_type:complete